MSTPRRESRSLLDFVLWHARIAAPHGSVQITEKGYTLKPRSLPTHHLIYVTRGQVVWVIEEVEHPLGPGDLLLLPPRLHHRAHSLTLKVTLGSLHVQATLPGGQDALKMLTPPRVRNIGIGSRLDGLWRGYMAEYEPERVNLARVMMTGWANILLLEMLRADAANGLLSEQPVDPLVSRVLDELHKNSRGEVSLSALAEWSGFTAQHLNRMFRRELGVTPLQYHTRLRLERAADLLAEGRLTVRAVASELGFIDPYYFSRLFRKRFGQSPSDFRHDAGSKSPSHDSHGPFPPPSPTA